ncbi:MAG: phosphate/phosphite/phosphonate ABC transporter substrate-binding protein [Acidiferrobacter sp.]
MRPWFVAVIGLVSWSASAHPVYTFMAPPRQGRAAAERVYGPIARYLTAATGASFVFRYTSNWISYMQRVQDNSADLYFDGPAFIGWRAERFHDRPAVRLGGHMQFVVVMKAGVRPPAPITALAGQSVCAFSPPNIATLTLDSWFPNPARQPYIAVIHSLPAAIKGVLAGRCVAAVVPRPVFTRLTHQFPGRLQIVYAAQPLPNQAFTLNARVPYALQQRVIAALLKPGGLAATARLRAQFGNKPLVPAHRQAYLPDAKLLHVIYGF